MNTVQVKIEFENSLRRVSFVPGDSLEKLQTTISSLIGVAKFDLKYRDEDGDLVTVGSTQELDDLVNEVKKTGKALRFIVVKLDQPTQTKVETPVVEESEEESKPLPYENLAKSFADQEFVSNLQRVFTSPIITEGLNQTAQTYLDTKGDMEATMKVAWDQWPLVVGLLTEMVEDNPVLKEFLHTPQSIEGFDLPSLFAFGLPFVSHFSGGAAAPFGDFRGFCGPFATKCEEQGERFQGEAFHPRVNCDGCYSSPELRRAATAAGTITSRGFISGLRYKSQSVHDFDLCESCKASDKFPDRAYGPFVTIEPVKIRGCGPRRGRCGAAWRSRCGREEARPMAETERTKEAEVVVEDLKTDENSKTEEWVPVVAPFTKWASQLAQLQELGFTRSETYIDFLEQEQGNVDAVVIRILNRDRT